MKCIIFLILFCSNFALADDSVFIYFEKNSEVVEFENQPAPRSPAALGEANSISNADVTDEYSIHRQDPLQVLDSIPEGEETLSRAWMEHKVGKELETASE